jgi:ABC-type tungstate transport system permease subunit
MKDEFEEDWYCTREAHASDSGYAWYQSFGNGYQDGLDIRNELRARAVRRLSI